MSAEETIGASLSSLEGLLAQARRILAPKHQAAGPQVSRAEAPGVASQYTAASAAKMHHTRIAAQEPQSSSILAKIQAQLQSLHSAQTVAASNASYRTPTMQSRGGAQPHAVATTAALSGAKTDIKKGGSGGSRRNSNTDGSRPDIFSRLYDRGMKAMRKRSEAPSYASVFAFKPNTQAGATPSATPGVASQTHPTQPLRIISASTKGASRTPKAASGASAISSGVTAGGDGASNNNIWDRLYHKHHGPARPLNPAHAGNRHVHRVTYTELNQQDHAKDERAATPQPLGNVPSSSAMRHHLGIVERLLERERQRELKLERQRQERDLQIRLQAKTLKLLKPTGHPKITPKLHLDPNHSSFAAQTATVAGSKPQPQQQPAATAATSAKQEAQQSQQLLLTPDGTWSRTNSASNLPRLGASGNSKNPSGGGHVEGGSGAKFERTDAPPAVIAAALATLTIDGGVAYHIDDDSFDAPFDPDLARPTDVVVALAATKDSEQAKEAIDVNAAGVPRPVVAPLRLDRLRRH